MELPVDFDREKAAGRGVQGGDGESELAIKAGFVVMDIQGAGIAQWLERGTRD